jgi:3'-5' exoribonuclease
MKSPYVADLPLNEPFNATFLVHAKEIRQKKSGDPYLSLTLADKTGDIDAKMWDNVADVMDTFERDDFIRIKAILQVFQNRPQLTLHKLQRVDDREIDFADYFPASARDPEQMWAELQGIVAGIGNPHLRALLEAILGEPRVAQAYKIAPAAKAIHHAFLSGLMEHVLSLCGLAKATAAHYANIDLDLLLTGAILHDIGKIDELTYDRGFGYSDEGQLIGHIVMAVRMIEDKVRNMPDFPPKLRCLLEHMILSHHGCLEFGSPKVPLFPEAMLLHQLDNLDSKMECMRSLAEKDSLVEGNWTVYSSALERAVLKKLRYLNGQGAAAAANDGAGRLRPQQRASVDDLASKFNVSRNR